MVLGFLALGFLFGTGAAVMTLVNGGGLLMALVAYGSGGAIAVLAPLLLAMLFSENDTTENVHSGQGASA